MKNKFKEIFPEKGSVQSWAGDPGRFGEGHPVYYYTEEQMNRFGELLVNECLTQIDDLINETGEEGAGDAYLRVKKHFGV